MAFLVKFQLDIIVIKLPKSNYHCFKYNFEEPIEILLKEKFGNFIVGLIFLITNSVHLYTIENIINIIMENFTNEKSIYYIIR